MAGQALRPAAVMARAILLSVVLQSFVLLMYILRSDRHVQLQENNNIVIHVNHDKQNADHDEQQQSITGNTLQRTYVRTLQRTYVRTVGSHSQYRISNLSLPQEKRDKTSSSILQEGQYFVHADNAISYDLPTINVTNKSHYRNSSITIEYKARSVGAKGTSAEGILPRFVIISCVREPPVDPNASHEEARDPPCIRSNLYLCF